MFSSLRKKLDEISLNPEDYQKIKLGINRAKNKFKNTIFRKSVIRSIIVTFGDIGTTYVNANLYGLRDELNPEARNYMEKYGIGEGLFRENINSYIIPLYAYTLLLYGSVRLTGMLLKHIKSEKAKNWGNKLNQNAYLFPDGFLDLYSATRWAVVANNFGIMVYQQLPQPYNVISYFATSLTFIAPMFYSLCKEYSKKLSNNNLLNS